jgi:hypothetical protein
MLDVTTRATFTKTELDDEALTTIVARSVLEAALAEEEGAELWFEVGSGEESARLAVELSAGDLEELLALSGSDDVALTLDSDEIAGLFDDAEVEAHGMRGAIAIAVTSAALLAPAGQAAVTQSVGTAATTQRAGIAATTQVSTSSVQRAAVNAQTARTQAKLKRNQVAKLQAFKILRSGLVR